jgi:hypothetical protein
MSSDSMPTEDASQRLEAQECAQAAKSIERIILELEARTGKKVEGLTIPFSGTVWISLKD